MKIATALSLLVFSLAARADGYEFPVPDRFLGHWAGDSGSCGSVSDDLALRFTPKSISFWETSGTIITVSTRGTNRMVLVAELSGEGETWIDTMIFEMSADGGQLVQKLTGPNRDVVRYKCPGAEGGKLRHISPRYFRNR